MVRRTTIEIDEDLLNRAKRALGLPTTRATVEEALRRVADEGDLAAERRAERQRRFLDGFGRHGDPAVLASEEMWR